MQQLITALDGRLTALITSLPAGLRPIMELASIIGQPVVMALFLVLAIISMRTSTSLNLVRAGIYSMLAILSVNILKLGLRRTRPDTYVPLLVKSYSFPSGHAFASLLALGLIAWFVHRVVGGAWAAVAIGGAVSLIGVIGISRVYVGAHYPSDVLGGWLLAGLVLTVIIIWGRI